MLKVHNYRHHKVIKFESMGIFLINYLIDYYIGVGKEVEMRYLSQLKKCPYPINGVYKVHHRAARNHFRRHADIKHRGEYGYREGEGDYVKLLIFLL